MLRSGTTSSPVRRLPACRFTCRRSNLTNEPFVTTNPGEDLQVIDYQRYGRRWMLGATYKFGRHAALRRHLRRLRPRRHRDTDLPGGRAAGTTAATSPTSARAG